MQFTEEAAKELLEYIDNNCNMQGIRIIAVSIEENIHYQIYWEKEQFPDDEVIIQNGLKIFLDFKTSEVLKEQMIFYTEKDGKKGLFIMKSISDCSTCSTVCF
ncbi:hypothetical protein [Niallia nealsonii]|uniref:Iron-sulfur cluster assembly accessory protein n=1 Tax=Niallia nealsonii TaxID=115979 RepID=A0A2N0YYG5_9BACI|nr:hypothetical protein [Niallia nealsonii]PKG22301.1 hypothetical protein CWS01_17875 [Niallia nealsonii]